MSERFELLATPIAGVTVVARLPRTDDRGWFERVYCDDELAVIGLAGPVRQINRSCTARAGAARGFHLQLPPFAEGKLVSCLRGAVVDVAVDLRDGSPTFGAWHAEELTAANRRSLAIAPGCAHGFQALTDDCELLYLHTERYAPDHEAGVSLRDPQLAVPWPLPMIEVSERDLDLPTIDRFAGVRW